MSVSTDETCFYLVSSTSHSFISFLTLSLSKPHIYRTRMKRFWMRMRSLSHSDSIIIIRCVEVAISLLCCVFHLLSSRLSRTHLPFDCCEWNLLIRAGRLFSFFAWKRMWTFLAVVVSQRPFHTCLRLLLAIIIFVFRSLNQLQLPPRWRELFGWFSAVLRLFSGGRWDSTGDYLRMAINCLSLSHIFWHSD